MNYNMQGMTKNDSRALRDAEINEGRNQERALLRLELALVFLEEERMMQYSRDKYFPQLRTKVINPVGEPRKSPMHLHKQTENSQPTQ